MRRLAALTCSLLAVLPCTVSAATLLVSPVPGGESVVSLDYTATQIRYEQARDRFYVERSMVSLAWAYESFFAGLGYVADTQLKKFDYLESEEAEESGSDPGFMLAAGARGAVWRSGEFAVDLYGQIHSVNEKLVIGGVRNKMQSIEIIAGAVAAWEPPGWRLYAGVEGVPYSDVTLEVAGYEEIDRSDFIVLHAGGAVDLGPCFLDLDAQFLGAEGVRLGLGYKF